jgi:hypothetical protein
MALDLLRPRTCADALRQYQSHPHHAEHGFAEAATVFDMLGLCARFSDERGTATSTERV